MRPFMLQRFIVRIIFMVPVYAVSSFCSLIFPHGAIYFDTVRIWCVPACLIAAPPCRKAFVHADFACYLRVHLRHVMSVFNDTG